MTKHKQLFTLVEKAYLSSPEEFAVWMWKNHVPVVAKNTLELAERFDANEDMAVAGALLHDFGDAFVDRFDPTHAELSETKATELLNAAGYSNDEVKTVLEEVIAPHSCKDGVLPTTLEGQVMATGDALAHLNTDFYLQFCWMNLPDGSDYSTYLKWVEEKIHRDFNVKIFFPEVKDETRARYTALKEIFVH